MQIPQYVDSPDFGATLVIGSDGLPVYQGMGSVKVTIQVPHNLIDFRRACASTLQYGHGLFSTRHEAEGKYLQQQANSFGYVLVSVDWIGLTEDDLAGIMYFIATNLTNFKMIPERTSQAMLHALSVTRLMRGAFLKEPVMAGSDGTPILDPPSLKLYYGNSLGGILGSVFMALTQDVPRGILGVAGGPFSLMLPRSVDFMDSLWYWIELRFANPIERILIPSMMQMLWDRNDPGGFMDTITDNPLPHTHKHHVLLTTGLGDAQVPYVASYVLARSVGAKIFASNLHEPGDELFGMESIKDSAVGHVMFASWDFPGVEPIPHFNVPANRSTDTHEGPRRMEDHQKMMYIFGETNQILNTCKGPCHGHPW